MWVIRDGDPAQKRERVDLNSMIYPGDIITIEESFF
jgi:polysaccharide export outer membrane protein